jgi:hippurate hydrolase
MLEDGLFERFPVDALFGLHNWPGVPTGEFRFIDGPAMAAVDWIIITIRGKGGHGAVPHEAVDPIVAASSLVLALQSLVSRNIDPRETAVVTVGMMHGGSMPTVIPDSVELQISTRAFTDAVRDKVRERIKVLAEAQAASFGAVAEVNHPPGFPALTNHRDETEFARQTAIRHFGEAKVGTMAPLLVSEDFAFMLQRQKGSYLFAGNGPSADLHSPRYDFNDAVIEPASRYWVALVEDYLGANG